MREEIDLVREIARKVPGILAGPTAQEELLSLHDEWVQQFRYPCMKHQRGDSCILVGPHSTHQDSYGRTW